MFHLEERETRFISIILRIYIASSFIYVPGMVLLPIAAIAAISLSLSAVFYLREVITIHTDAFKKIKRILTVESEDDEGQLLFRSENGNDSDIDSDGSSDSGLVPSFSLRDALMLENNLHEQSPLLSTHGRQKVSFVNVLNDSTRYPCVATSTDVSPTVVVDIGESAISSITGGRNDANLEQPAGTKEGAYSQIIHEPESNKTPEETQVLFQNSEHAAIPALGQTNAETATLTKSTEQEPEISSRVESLPEENKSRTDSNTEFSQDTADLLDEGQTRVSSIDVNPHLSPSTDHEQICNSSNEEGQDIGENIFDDILTDVVQNHLSREDNPFDDSFIGEAFEDVLKENQALPVSLSLREPFRLPPAEVSAKSTNEAHEGPEELPSGVFEAGQNSSEESGSRNNSLLNQSANSHMRRNSSIAGQHSSTMLDNLLFMNQEDDEIERLLIEGSAERREKLHRDVSGFLEPSPGESASDNSTSGSNTPISDDPFEEIPLTRRTNDGKSLEEILDDLRSSRRLTPLQQSYRAEYGSEDIQTPERTVSFEYFLSPMPRSRPTEFEKLPPAAASVDGSAHREPNVMHRMYNRSAVAPTLTFDADLYRPPRRRRVSRAMQTPPSLQASPSELSARGRRSRDTRPALPPATSLSATLLPRDRRASDSFEDISPTRSVEDLLEPLLLAEVDGTEGSTRSRRNSAGRQRSIMSEMANRRKSLERSAKSIGRRAGLLKKSSSPK